MTKATISIGNELVTKAELCRRVLALDPHAKPFEVLARVREKYGVEINSGTASQMCATYGAKKVVAKAADTQPSVDVFIEGLKHIQEAVKLLGDKNAVKNVIELL